MISVRGRDFSFLRGPAVYVFSAPSEKTVMFLNSPFCRETAALSGMSDECSRLKVAAMRSSAALAASRQNGTFRNITVFESGAENTYTAGPRRKEKSRPRTDTTPERTRPCDGSVYPLSPTAYNSTLRLFSSFCSCFSPSTAISLNSSIVRAI